MNLYLFFMGVFFTLFVDAQEIISTEYFHVEMPSDCKTVKFKVSRSMSSNVEVYKVLDNEGDLKYLTYFMSDELLTEPVEISSQNLKKYLLDTDYETVVNIEKLPVKNIQKVDLNIDSNIVGIVYIKIVNDILYRVMFMIPKKLYSESLDKETLEIISRLTFVKDHW